MEALDPQEEEEEGWENEANMLEREVLYIPTSTNLWYNDMKYYLTYGSSQSHLDARKRRALRLKYAQYKITNGVLFQQNYDNVFHRCLEKDDVEHILIELHDGLIGSHSTKRPLHIMF